MKYKDAPENRLKRGHQQREAYHKGSEEEKEVGLVLSGFSLTLRPQKYYLLKNQALKLKVIKFCRSVRAVFV